MPFVVAAVGGGLLLGAEVYSGITKSRAEKSAAKEADYNAHISEVMTRVNLLRQERKTYEILGTEEAATAAAGFSISGSALDLLHSSVANASLDASLIANKGELEARGFRAQASADRAAATGTLIDTGVGVVKTIASAYGSSF